MKLDDFIKAIPKVELGLRFEGAVRKQILLTIAEQNDIPDKIKRFGDWAALLEKPDYKRLDDIIRMVTTWWQYPEDFSRMAYDAGVMLARENVKYAEVLINPTLLLPQATMSVDELLEALNDGRDRAMRGWGVRLEWILVAPRDEPRKFEELVRWATSTVARRNSIVAVGLIGKEDPLVPNPFERSVVLANKKDLPIVVQAGHQFKADGVLQAIRDLSPSRILDAWGLVDAPDAINQILEREITVVGSLGRAVHSDWIKRYTDYPLGDLMRQGIKPVISADMPTYYKSTLTGEYQAVVQHTGLPIEALEELALNAVASSFLSPLDKAEMIEQFASAYAQLKEVAE
ncbi:MAG: hypothetical protein MUE54_10570 [Anaerolineae bacterium]|jgi:adenosine deaminase|nr:hypothetical protein [Anaerolineae bacterium]